MTNKTTFFDLGLSKEIVSVVEKKGFTEPTPIQVGVIPLLLNGNKDIIGQAQTGTGKTAAFAIPLLMNIDASFKKTQAIILTPTRELAMQVAKEIESFSVKNSPSLIVVYGGNPMYKEISSLKKNPQIVVGTPGRVQHHIRNGKLRLDSVRYFVLDEADEMLNFGFREDIENILEKTPKGRRVLLFSATMPKSIMNIVKNYMGDYDFVKVDSKVVSNENVLQKFYVVKASQKLGALLRIIEFEDSFYSIVFCRTRVETDFVANELASRNFRAEAIHGDIDQNQREKILSRFRSRKTSILVATDVAARGLDIDGIDFVVNYSLPENHEIYVHRIGRTGRAGNKGKAVSFVTGREVGKMNEFARRLKLKIEKGVLPTVESVVERKKEALVNRLEHIVDYEDLSDVLPLARLLLSEGNAENVVAGLIKDAYKNEFDVASYEKIFEDSVRGGNRSGRSGGKKQGGSWRVVSDGSGRGKRDGNGGKRWAKGGRRDGSGGKLGVKRNFLKRGGGRKKGWR